MQYITIDAKSDDCADPNPIVYYDEPLTREEAEIEYWPFLSEPTIREIATESLVEG